jgi:DNA-directed RNA polymerase specialized sigma24 family protein
MARSPQAEATQRLLVALRNHQAALAASERTKSQYRRAIVDASQAGVSKTEIARLCGTSDTRVHQIIKGEVK